MTIPTIPISPLSHNPTTPQPATLTLALALKVDPAAALEDFVEVVSAFDLTGAAFDIAGQTGADFVQNLGVVEFADLLKVCPTPPPRSRSHHTNLGNPHQPTIQPAMARTHPQGSTSWWRSVRWCEWREAATATARGTTAS